MSYTSNRRGLIAIVLAFAIWGLFPVYFKWLSPIPAIELLLARIILTAGACLVLLPFRGSWKEFRSAWTQPPRLKRSLAAAILLSGNWFSFIWAVNNGRVLESSLGYFLCPLMSVVLGFLVLKESLGVRQWLAVGLAAGGVLIQILQAGTLPLAAVTIAVTWSGYGLLKKRSLTGPLVGLGLETSLLSPLAMVVLAWMASSGPVSFTGLAVSTWGFLLFAGFLTAAPLILFAYAAQRIRLSTMGMGQYIVPSAHFGLAVLYGEPVGTATLIGFGLIWCGLGLYSLDHYNRPLPA